MSNSVDHKKIKEINSLRQAAINNQSISQAIKNLIPPNERITSILLAQILDSAFELNISDIGRIASQTLNQGGLDWPNNQTDTIINKHLERWLKKMRG